MQTFGITLFESGKFGGVKLAPPKCIPTLRANKVCAGVVEVEKIEVKVLGQMDNTMDNTSESANRVYDENGLAQTVNTCGGGGLQPKIVEVKQLGFMDNGTGKHQSNTVYDTDGISPNITTIEGGGTQQIKILSVDAIRMVRTEEGKKLRKAYESGEIHHGFNEYRKAELREDDCSNTLSTVLKDNLICERHIVAMRGRNPDNPSDRTAGSPTEQRLEPNSEGICNTLTSVQKDNMVLEISTTIDEKFHKFLYLIDGNLYLIRIRKLIPKECWSLMDFTESDFISAEKVVSNSQLYKQAGNSIVKRVLMAIIGQMIPGEEDVYKKLETR